MSRYVTDDLIEQIANGKPRCPTMFELDELIEAEFVGASLSQRLSWVREHKATCPKCLRIYEIFQDVERNPDGTMILDDLDTDLGSQPGTTSPPRGEVA